MELKRAFGITLRDTRKARRLSQEDFGSVISQTFMSQLESGTKGPTLEKMHDIAAVMGVHPITILTRCYLLLDDTLALEQLLERVRAEIDENPNI